MNSDTQIQDQIQNRKAMDAFSPGWRGFKPAMAEAKRHPLLCDFGFGLESGCRYSC